MLNEEWYLNPKVKNLDKKVSELKESKKIVLDDFTLKYLVLNGYDTVEKIYNVMYFKEKDIPNVLDLKDADIFLSRLIKAISNREEITLIADYDADGIDAAAVFMQVMKTLNVDANYFVSHRFKEGYGISRKSVKRLIDTYPKTSLIVTVDNGISGFEGVDFANENGIDVIISDHHEPKEDGTLPKAIAIVDAKRLDDTYPFKDLCGAGLIYKLMCELYKRAGEKKEHLHYLLAYVACATIGDVVSLTGENRYYVKQGIKEIKESNLKCFETLNKLCGVSDVNEETLGFTYVPIFNAIGRINGDVIPAIDFLLETDDEKSSILGEQLLSYNAERKKLCETEEAKADKQLEKYINDSFIILADKTFHEGTVGILAGRVKEKQNKPVIVFTESEEDSSIFKGSSRSVPGFNIKKALDLCADLLLGYGGHELAAGLSIKKENLEQLRKKMCELAQDKAFFDKKNSNKLYIDFAITENDINFHLINALNTELRPFGQGFPKPVIGLREFHASNIMTMPKEVPTDEKKHVKLANNNLEILWFNGFKEWNNLNMPTSIKCIGVPSVNFFRGKKTFQFQIQNNKVKTI